MSNQKDEASVSVLSRDGKQPNKSIGGATADHRDLNHGGATWGQPGRGGGFDLPKQAPNERPDASKLD